MAGVGIPDAIAFSNLFCISMVALLLPTLQYASIAVEKYGEGNLSLIIQCFSNHDKSNGTCSDIGDYVQEHLTGLNVQINIVKGIMSPFFAILLGGCSDAIGKLFGIHYLLSINMIHVALILVNTFYITTFPSWMYVIISGFFLGMAGGSTFTINNFLVGYLSLTTPPQKQTTRFSTLFAIGLFGAILGPLSAGIITKYTTKYYIIVLIGGGFNFSALLLSFFCLKNVDDEQFEDRFPGANSFCQRLGAALKYQYYNTVDMFKHQAYLDKFIGANLMYMLSSVGFIAPMLIIASVYVLGAPFKWSSTSRGYFVAGLGLLLALHSIVTIRILKWFNISRPSIARIGIFIGFLSTFFLALADTNTILLIGVGLVSFIILSTPTLQSMIISLVEPEQVGSAVGVMTACQGFAECVLVNIVLVVYQNTHQILNGLCFFTLSFLIGIDLVIAMFYQHPQTTREDRNPLTSGDGELPPPPYSSDVLKGGVPKSSVKIQVS